MRNRSAGILPASQCRQDGGAPIPARAGLAWEVAVETISICLLSCPRGPRLGYTREPANYQSTRPPDLQHVGDLPQLGQDPPELGHVLDLHGEAHVGQVLGAI